MSEEIRINRPSTQSQESNNYRGGQGSSKLPWVILAIVVIVIVVFAIVFREKLFSAKGGGEAATSKASGYQAIFLTNGQVYFGKMSGSRDSYVTLKDIFYLQVQNPAIQGSQAQQQAAQQQPQLSLVKLGQELHGPVDQMHINSDQILFYEDMKEDSKVVQAIKEYKANPNGAGKNPPDSTTAPVSNGAVDQKVAPSPTKAASPAATPRSEE